MVTPSVIRRLRLVTEESWPMTQVSRSYTRLQAGCLVSGRNYLTLLQPGIDIQVMEERPAKSLVW